MEEPVKFYCPYDLTIETMTMISDSKLKVIEELRKQGLTEVEIDDLMM